MFDREKNDNFIWGGRGGIYFLLCLPPYNSDFQYFEIKPLVPRTSNLRDSTVIIFVICLILGESWKISIL